MSKTFEKRKAVLDKYIQEKWDEYFWDFIMRRENKINWYLFSKNPNITMEMIERHPDKPWDWFGISQNPNLTIEMITTYPKKSWDWGWISYNPNITMEMIEKYPNKIWNWNWISRNVFKKEKELFYEKWYRKYMAVFRIQQYYNRAIDNPEYKLCRDVFHKKWEEGDE